MVQEDGTGEGDSSTTSSETPESIVTGESDKSISASDNSAKN